MARRQHIDHILRSWSHQHGEVAARIVRGDDGRDVLQMRLEMGLLQMEVEGRPDGGRPHGYETYYDYLMSLAFKNGERFALKKTQCREVDREFVQFYHRRICWLALGEHGNAARDADHTLALMDLSSAYCPSDRWVASHEQYRPFVLFHRTQARAFAALEHDGPEQAMEEINDGLDRLRCLLEQDDAEEMYGDGELVDQLVTLKESLRKHYAIGPTLTEQLAEAIAREQYERAAQLRDEIQRRTKSRAD